jgi:hypothetical protein
MNHRGHDPGNVALRPGDTPDTAATDQCYDPGRRAARRGAQSTK